MWVEINHACRTIHITNKENALHKTIIAKYILHHRSRISNADFRNGPTVCYMAYSLLSSEI